MNKDLLELYSDYLLSSFSYTTATGLSRMSAAEVSHDKITRFLASEEMDSRALWRLVKPLVPQVEDEDGVLIIDDTIEEKPYTDESELVCWHYEHSKGRSVKGINLITARSTTSRTPKEAPSRQAPALRWPSSWSRRASGSLRRRNRSGEGGVPKPRTRRIEGCFRLARTG
jgi:hypothetical protein